MDTGFLRLEREVAQLQRELQTLKLTRYTDSKTSEYYMFIKGLHARRKALLEISRGRSAIAAPAAVRAQAAR